MSTAKDMKEYLSQLDIPTDEKRYALSFCKKLEYLDNLQRQVAIETKEQVESGYGDANSKICFIFKDKQELKSVRPILQTCLNEFSLNFWQVWITFVNKTPSEYVKKYDFLAHEVNAINPDIVYVFTDDPDLARFAGQAIQQLRGSNLQHCFFINTSTFSKEGADLNNLLRPYFHYLINYQSITINKQD